MSERKFEDALKEADRANESRQLPPEAERRIRARAEAAFERHDRFKLPAWGVGLAGAIASAGLVIYALSGAPPAPPDVNGFIAENGSNVADALLTQGSAVVANARVELVDPASRIHLVASRGATLQREPRGVRVRSGTVDVSVEKRRPGEAPALVFVSDGAIEILGTRFTIVQSEGGGEVTLHEGSIRFLAGDDRVVVMVPGETLRWPLAPIVAIPPPAQPEVAADPGRAPSAPAIAATAPQKPRAAETRPAPVPAAQPVAPPMDVDALIEEINVLRRKGQFADAASRLEMALERQLPEATSERLSYELGSILTWQLKDPSRGCAVWKAHRSAHPAGRYAAEVSRAEAALACR